MSDQRDGGIAWTEATWNPVRGCTPVSEGCRNCYAMRQAVRFAEPGQPYEGLAHIVNGHPAWTGEVRLVHERLADPLRWRRPRRVFVNSMSDLFHEMLTFNQIAAVFGVMAAVPRHTFQCLTKRPKRMREWFEWIADKKIPKSWCVGAMVRHLGEASGWNCGDPREWPLPNVWLGVSVEDQKTADERIPLLLETPAALHWVSYEPALGPVDFTRWLGQIGELGAWTGFGARLDWIVVGGESGPGARPFDIAWARSTIAACRAAGVPAFMKQIGARPVSDGLPLLRPDGWKGTKGGDPAEWPEDLRVREFPSEVRA